MTQLYSFRRPIDYMRISVTDRCNLRCIYCMPAAGVPWLPKAEILTFEEIAAVARVGAELGISKLRLTGGEPLARLQLSKLIQMLSQIPGIDDIALTTNGLLMARYAEELKAAGLKRVNISLDTKDPVKFARLARRDRLEDVFEGIAAAKAVGLWPIKLNMVVWRGINDDEVVDFARMTLEEEWHVRFIELMPFAEEGLSFAGSPEDMEGYISTQEVKAKIEAALGSLEPAAKPGSGNGPAEYFRLCGAKGTVGFISPLSDAHFCAACNKIRLTADGKIRPCLLSDLEVDVKGPLRAGASMADIKAILEHTVAFIKPDRHYLGKGVAPKERRYMVQIGG